ELAQSLLAEERWRQILSSLVVCFFARGIYSPELVSRTLRISGMNISPDDLTRIGEEIHREKYLFKVREGFSFASLRLPRRIFEVASPAGAIEEEYLRKALAFVEKDVLGKASL
ncbi:MAG: aldehyde:ferredoxin oxidoreductase, partial [Proteobacteria bacterium]|nr:aldehyde:ferredoxin oxidoreductase [Pseudomonadota bacterium]